MSKLRLLLFFSIIFFATSKQMANAQTKDEILNGIDFEVGKYPLLIINQTVQKFSLGLFDNDPEKGGKVQVKTILESNQYCILMLPVDRVYYLITHQITELIEINNLSLSNHDNSGFVFISTAHNGKTITLKVEPEFDKNADPISKVLYVFNRTYEYKIVKK